MVSKAVAGYCLLFSLECSCIVLSMVTRDTLFLRCWDFSYLPLMTILAACSTGLVTNVHAYAITNWQKVSRYIPALIPSISGVLVVLFWFTLRYNTSRYAVATLYICVEIYVQLIVQQFWEQCSEAFDVRQSKKYFGYINIGSTAGTLCTGVILIPFLRSREISTQNNLLIVGLQLQLIAAMSVYLRQNSNFCAKYRHAQSGGEKESPKLSIFKLVWENPYFQHICLFEILATIVRVMIDFQTLRFLSTYSEDVLKASLGLINGVQSTLMLPLQFIAPIIFSRLGVMHGIASLPLATSVFGIATYLSDDRILIIVCRGVYNGVTYAIYNTSRELLWLPLSVDERRHMKLFVNGTVRSVSRISGAFLSIALNSTEDGTLSTLSKVIATLGVLWGCDALAARRAYGLQFYASLKRGIIQFDSPHVDILPDQVTLIRQVLKTGANNQIRYVLSALPSTRVRVFAKELREIFFLRKTPLHIRLRIVDLVAAALQQGDIDNLFFTSTEIIQMATAESSVRLRCAAILACCYEKNSEKCLAYANEFRTMLQSRPSNMTYLVRCCGAIALLRLTNWVDETAHLVLQQLIYEENDPIIRGESIRLIGKEVPDLIGNGYLIYLLNQETPLSEAALQICQYRDPSSVFLIPTLVQKLGLSRLRAHAVQALKRFRPSCVWKHLVPFVEKAVQDIRNDCGSEATVSAILGSTRLLASHMFPFDATIDFLLRLLENLYDCEAMFTWQNSSRILHLRGQLVEIITSKLNSAKVKNPDHLNCLSKVISRELRYVYELQLIRNILSQGVPDATGGTMLLFQHLDETSNAVDGIILRLCSVFMIENIHINLIIDGLHSDSQELKTAIEEILDNMLPAIHRPIVMHRLFSKYKRNRYVTQMEGAVSMAFMDISVEDFLRGWVTCGSDTLAAISIEYWSIYSPSTVLSGVKMEDLPASPLLHDVLRKCEIPLKLLDLPLAHETESISQLEIASCLQRSDLFRHTSITELIQRVSIRLTQVSMKKKTTFVREGDHGKNMFIIYEGEVCLRQADSTVARLGTGDSVGEIFVLQNSSVFPFSATCVTDCKLLLLSQYALSDLLSNTSIARGLFEACITVLQRSNQVSVDVRISEMRRAETRAALSRQSSLRIKDIQMSISKRNRVADMLGRSKSVSNIDLSGIRDHDRGTGERTLRDLCEKFVQFPAWNRDRESMSRFEKCIILKGSDIFKLLDDHQVALVAELCTWRKYASGAVVYEEGQEAKEAWVIIDGYLTLGDKDTFGPGACVGEVSFHRGSCWNDTARADSPVDALVLRSQDLVEIAVQHQLVLQALLSWLSTRVLIPEHSCSLGIGQRRERSNTTQ